MSSIIINNTLRLQSPYLYCQAAGSDESDNTKGGIHLRWDLMKELGDNHIPKGNIANPGDGFNKNDDFVTIYRSLYYTDRLTTVDFNNLDPARVSFLPNHAGILYNITMPWGSNAIIVRFLNRAKFRLILDQGLNTVNPVQDFLNRYDGIIEVEVQGKLMFNFEMNFSSGNGLGGAAIETVFIKDRLDKQSVQVVKREQLSYNSLMNYGVRTTAENICYFRIQQNGMPAPLTLTLYTYEDVFNEMQERQSWENMGNFSLSLDDNEVFSRFQGTSFNGGNLSLQWPKYNEGVMLVPDNYTDRWINNDGGLKTTIQQFIQLSNSHPKAYQHFLSEPPVDSNGLTISLLDMLKIAAIDYHAARMMGLGFIDGLPLFEQDFSFIYAAVYTTHPELPGIGIDNTHLFLTLPTKTADYRLPGAPTLKEVSYGLYVSTEGNNEPELLSKPDGYSLYDETRFINLHKTNANAPKAVLNNIPQNESFDGSSISQPAGFGIKYKEKQETEWRQPELLKDDEYRGSNQELETVITPERDDNPLYTHRETETGVHQYALYAVNWFSRISVLTNIVETDTTAFVKHNRLLPPFNLAVQYIQEEDPLIFTTQNEQDELTAANEVSSSGDNYKTRVTFDWNNIHNNAYQSANKIEFFFRDRPIKKVEGRIKSVISLSGSATECLVVTQSFLMASVNPPLTIMPSITADEEAIFIGSMFNTPEGQFTIVSITQPGSVEEGPSLIVKKLVTSEAIQAAVNDPVVIMPVYTEPKADDVFFIFENVSSSAGWIKLNKTVDLVNFSTDKEIIYEDDGSSHSEVVGGINNRAEIVELPNLEGGYTITFSSVALEPHPDPSVSWIKGSARFTLASFENKKKTLPVVSILQTNPIKIVVYDPDYFTLPTERIAVGNSILVNFHPGYKVYLSAEEGIFGKSKTMPALNNNNKKTYIAARSADTFFKNTSILDNTNIIVPDTPTSYQAQSSITNEGNDAYQGEVGTEFQVNISSGIRIIKLGAFDDLGTGITGTVQQNGGIRVAIFRKSDQTIVAGLDMIIKNTEGIIAGNYRVKDLPLPVTLPPGRYVVVAKGFNSGERLHNAVVPGGVAAIPNDGNGAITFIESCFGASDPNGFSYPTGTYPVPNVLIAGTFIFESVANTSTSHQAQTSPTSVGNQAYQGETGTEFRVNAQSGITITKLGAFDDLGNGITGTPQQSGGIRVAIFKKSDQTIVAGLDMIIKNTEGTLAGNYRIKELPLPVTLLPGNYVAVAKGYNTTERLHNAVAPGGVSAIPDDGGGAISFIESRFGADDPNGFSYPVGIYPIPNVLITGTFVFQLEPTVISTSHQAHTSPTNTGNQAFRGEVGNEFKVNAVSGITITKLGAFDDLGNGITGSVEQSGGIRVAVFKKSDHNIVPGLDIVVKNMEGSLAGNYRMKDLPSPVTLPAGSYIVVAKGYNSTERLHNAIVPGGTPAVPDNGGGAITFIQSLYGNDDPNGFIFPANIFATPNVLVAGTFAYDLAGNYATIYSSFTPPVVLLAKSIIEPVIPETITGPLFATRPDFFGKATYTIDIKLNISNRLPFGLVVYRANEMSILQALYKPETVRQVINELTAITDNDSDKFERWKSLIRVDLETNTDNQFPLFGAYRFPTPDNESTEVYTSAVVSIRPFPLQPGETLQSKKSVVKKVIEDVFSPLTITPIVFQYLKKGYQTSSEQPTTKNIIGRWLDPGDTSFNPFPMAVKFPALNPETVRFTDYTLSGSSRNIYFYFAREIALDEKLSERTDVLGPVILVDAAPAEKPKIRRVITQEADPILSRPAAIRFELTQYINSENIKQYQIFRTTNVADAATVRSMQLASTIEVENEVEDTFVGLAYPPFGQPLFYRIVALRHIVNEKGNFEVIPSLPSEMLLTNIIDVLNPAAPEITYTTGGTVQNNNNEIIALTDVSLSWPQTVYNGTYYLYKMNEKGNYEKLWSKKTNAAQILFPESADPDTFIKMALLEKIDDEGNAIYHRFKVSVENASGLFNLEDNELVI